MRPFIAFDTETHLIAPGLRAPPLVCLTCASATDGPWIMLREQALAWIRGVLESDLVIVGHSVSFDLAVLAACDETLLPLIFAAYAADRVTDTELRQKLADIGRGRYRTRQYNLGSVGVIHGFRVNKEDTWRLRYSELDGVPLEQWPEDAKRYALDDAACTAHVYVSQEARYRDEGLLVDEYAQARKFWALDLCSAWGLRTSPRGVASLEQGARERLDELESILKEEGLVRANGSRDTKKAKARMLECMGESARRTKGGDVCLDSDACTMSGDPLLESYAEASSLKKVLSNDVAALTQGITMPIHTNFDLADTGRTTSSKPNVQNPRRLPGVRECFVPRGWLDETQ
jgi:DNA polymerase-1